MYVCGPSLGPNGSTDLKSNRVAFVPDDGHSAPPEVGFMLLLRFFTALIVCFQRI